MKRLKSYFKKARKKGFYVPLLKSFLYFLERLSLNYWLNECIKNAGFTDDSGNKAQPWISELYQFIFVALGGVSLILIKPDTTHIFLSMLITWLLLYRLFDILVFILNWIFVHTGRLHDPRRSLAGFMLNIFEVALYASVIDFLEKCIPSITDKWLLTYDHLKGIVTFTPPLSEKCSPLCTTLTNIEFFLSLLLVLVVIGTLVGDISRDKDGNKISDKE